MPTSSLTLAKAQKLVPAAVLKQLRAAATAAADIKYYDHVLAEEWISTIDMKKMMFNYDNRAAQVIAHDASPTS